MARDFTGETLKSYLSSSTLYYAIPSAATILFYAKTSTDGTYAVMGRRSLTGTAGGWTVRRDAATNALLFSMFNGSGDHTFDNDSFPADGEWHAYAITLSGGTLTCYLDGVSVGAKTSVTYQNPSANVALLFGSWREDAIPRTDFIYTGNLAEVALFARALTTTEIGYYSDGYGPNLYSTSLDHYWRLTETSGSASATTGGITLIEWDTGGVGSATHPTMDYSALPGAGTEIPTATGALTLTGVAPTLLQLSYQTLNASADVTTTNWTPSTGLTLWEMVDEATPSDADYISTATIDAECEIQLEAGTVPSQAGYRTLQVRLPSGFTPTGGMTVTLMNGAAQVQTWTTNSPAADTTYDYAVTEALTDFSNLRVRLKSVA
jgi:hypothetical protein